MAGGNALVELHVQWWDIAQIATDVLVNAVNNHLWVGVGVAGAITRTGGKKIEAEAFKKAPISVAEAIATGGGRLKAKYVIHTVAMGQYLMADAEKIRRATGSSLPRCDELGIESITFPALCIGIDGFPKDEYASIMIEDARRYSTEKQD